MNIRTRAAAVLTASLCCLAGPTLSAQKAVFQAPGRHLGVWQLTFEPTARHWANYHNTQCFSPDGRHVCYIRQPAVGPVSVRVFDLHQDREILIGEGQHPRWAKHHNWLFFAHYNTQHRTREHPGAETIMYDMDAGRPRVVMAAPGAEALGGTSHDDRWLIGAQRFRRQTPEYRYVRIRIPEGGFERMPDMTSGSQLLPNPRRPLFFARDDHRSDPFEATRYFYDLDGGNRRIAVPTLQQCHMSWLGNGEYFLLGNGLVRGRKWNEPFPSNIHVLSHVSVGDISPCGASGRWVCGDSALADLRSGDGWDTIEPLSVICYPARIGDNSGIYDADPKGSPDGTKICFVSNYPLEDGPRTRIVRNHRDALEVASTAGFPERGHLVISREVVAYDRKTATRFEGLRRQAFDTAGTNLREGRVVTSFEARSLSEKQYASLERPAIQMVKSIGDLESPLMRQRMTDVYIVVVRRPDRPHLRAAGQRVQLIPGENHRETRGYHLFRDGRQITKQPLSAGASELALSPGEYQCVAVEWSALASEPSLKLSVERPAKLSVLHRAPNDFSWTTERWTDDSHSERELVHRHDGVIRREWLGGGVLIRRHDLNEAGKATRRIDFRNGKMAVRELYRPNGEQVSREVFDEAGYITESIRFGTDGADIDHWWYENGWPVKHVRGGREFVRNGSRWGYYQDPGGRFIDLPRER